MTFIYRIQNVYTFKMTYIFIIYNLNTFFPIFLFLYLVHYLICVFFLYWCYIASLLCYSYVQWVRKIFRPPYIFHYLLYCSHLLKSFKFICFLINVHTAAHIDRKTQNCWHFCRFIKKEKLKYHMVLYVLYHCMSVLSCMSALSQQKVVW